MVWGEEGTVKERLREKEKEMSHLLLCLSYPRVSSAECLSYYGADAFDTSVILK